MRVIWLEEEISEQGHGPGLTSTAESEPQSRRFLSRMHRIDAVIRGFCSVTQHLRAN